ncbi:MAG: outer membrane lipoprotein carrier protein LolA [Thermodesulfovibrionales bacterium]|nr:outer membrane lipoprotein carrier protein LolA [Thermodesulfovibrionales bacterium]
MKKLSSLIFLFVFLFLASVAFAGDLEDIKLLQKGMRSVKASFTQTKTTELLGRPIRSSGTFSMKAGAGVRWDYKDSMVVIYDGRDLYLHYLELEEAERIRGASGFVGPLVFDVQRLSENYRVTAMRTGEGIRLTLVPQMDMPFERMEMNFPAGSPFPDEVAVIESTGDKTVIRFSEVEVGAVLHSDLFVFTPPPGVIVRQRSFQ